MLSASRFLKPFFMIYCVLFEDDGRFLDMRQRHMEAHLAFLRTHADQIAAAGPLVDTQAEVPSGGLWLVTADDSETVWLLVEMDPLWPTGLRKSVRVLRWQQVFSAAK
jgi:uncharacterized protein YciI